MSGHMSQGDLNSNLLPNTTFPIGNWKKRKNNSPKKNSKKIKKIKKNQRDLNSNLLPNTTFPIVENCGPKKNSKKIKKIKKNQKNSKNFKKFLNSNLHPTLFLSKKQTYLKPVIDQCMGVYSSFSAFEDNNKF